MIQERKDICKTFIKKFRFYTLKKKFYKDNANWDNLFNLTDGLPIASQVLEICKTSIELMQNIGINRHNAVIFHQEIKEFITVIDTYNINHQSLK